MRETRSHARWACVPACGLGVRVAEHVQDPTCFLPGLQIVLEMRKTKMLDQQVGEATNVLTSTRSLMGGIYNAKEQSVTVQKRIKLLENRLEKAYVKYNQSVTHNKQLREQINNLRRERLMFESIHSTLERELAKIKRDMADTIQLANQVRSGRGGLGSIPV